MRSRAKETLSVAERGEMLREALAAEYPSEIWQINSSIFKVSIGKEEKKNTTTNFCNN